MELKLEYRRDEEDDDRIVELLERRRDTLDEIEATGLRQPACYYPARWLAMFEHWPEVAHELDRRVEPHSGCSHHRFPAASIDREELVSYGAGALTDPVGMAPLKLFAACQVWGSGTTGRQWLTECATRDPRLVPTLQDVCVQLNGDTSPGAYYQHAPVSYWGPSFVSKFLYALALSEATGHLDALILDQRIWEALDALQWDSRSSAGARSWARRYEAYVLAVRAWADRLDVRADTLERLLWQQKAAVIGGDGIS